MTAPAATPAIPCTSALIATIVGEIQNVLGTFDYQALDGFADRLAGAAHVVVAGEGRSGFMARAFAMRLMHLGLHVHVVGETTTPALRQGDLVVAVSGSGTTMSTVRTAEQARAVGATVVAVSTDPAAPLADAADAVVTVPAATKYRRPGEAATIQPLSSLFDQVCHLVFDAVCLRLALLREVDNAAAREAHANTE